MKYEYLSVDLQETSIEIKMNKLGKEGWELVSVDKGIGYFKRMQ